jgi:hypothetical protein
MAFLGLDDPDRVLIAANSVYRMRVFFFARNKPITITIVFSPKWAAALDEFSNQFGFPIIGFGSVQKTILPFAHCTFTFTNHPWNHNPPK